MGSWNGTCMISNLPIIYGEKIKLVLLEVQNGRELNSSGVTYPYDIMTPLFMPISGKYNDYGMIGDIKEDWNYKIIESYIKENFYEISTDGEPERGTTKDINLEVFLKSIERSSWGGFFGKAKEDSDFKPLSFAYTMIREDVWNGIIKKFPGKFRNDNDEERNSGQYTISADEYYKRKYQRILKSLDELEEKLKNSATEEEKREIYLEDLIYSSRRDKLFSEMYSTGFLSIGGYIYETYLKENKSDRDDILKLWIEHVTICDFLQDTRKMWMITAGAGSQDTNWEAYVKLNDIVNEICDNKLLEEGEDWDSDWDWEEEELYDEDGDED